MRMARRDRVTAYFGESDQPDRLKAITRHHPGAQGSEYLSTSFHGVVWGISHGGFPAFQVGVGILLFLAAIRLAWAAFSLPGSRIRTVGVLGAVAVLGRGSTARRSWTSTRTSAR